MAIERGAGPPKGLGLPKVIGGYRMLRELGRDRLGPVLVARHRATGRDVALTVLRHEWACLPRYVSRLARDAFAAAQVVHPNLVRLYEFGEAQGRVHFAAELVDGTTLALRVGQRGPLPPRDAVAHILQAARGLAFAHGHGMAHGDLGPGDIVVDHDGVTKVSHLGLVKTPESVAAEEAREATGPVPVDEPARGGPDGLDARVDLRGLGRTLDHLLTGSSPIVDGNAADAPGLVARGVPADLAELVAKLVDARPGHGYADLGQGVAALERALNARAPGSTAPREEDTRILLEHVDAFRTSPAAQLRSRLVHGGAAACALVVLVSLIARQPRVAGGFFALGLMTAMASFVIDGVARRTPLFAKVRGLVLESRGADWLIGLAGVALVVTALVVLRLHWAYLAFAILGLILAMGLYHEFDRKVAAERRGAVEGARALLKALRLQGVGEETLRRFVRGTAIDDWEGFFDALFGDEATRAAREPSDRGLTALIRKRSLPWRDWATSWVDARQEARRQAREEALLQAIEERGLVAEGINLVTARRKARRIAGAMVAVSSEVRAAGQGATPRAESGSSERATVARAIRRAAEAPEHVLVEREHGLIRPEASRVRGLLLGRRTRFLIGAALLAGCLLWVDQNGIVTGAQVKDVAARAIEQPDSLRALRDARIDFRVPERAQPLRLAFLPRPVSRLFRNYNPGVAGLILILSTLVPGGRAGLFAFGGAAIALIGAAADAPRIGPFDPQAAGMALGAGVAALGIFFGGARVD